MEIEERFAQSAIVAEHYQDFVDFAVDGMDFLGYPLTEVQEDIGLFMQNGPRLRMVQAQRGEAKSTLAALYAVWRIIQRNSTIVLIISGGEKQASEVATLVVRLITTWDILAYLTPDKQAGDRSSIEGFDVHYALKGLNKSPSVACVGITSNLPGKRADVLIADDVETTKNGLTAVQRAQLAHLTKEFTSICSTGDILYLGTPQTKDSVYNGLPARGFTVRIWPGRYPTDEELPRYGDRLAAMLVERLRADKSLQTGGGLDGKRGQPTDPARFNESALCEKELDQGPEGFSLQYMLDTTLSDAARQQLKLSDLIIANFGFDRVPEIIGWQASPRYEVPIDQSFPVPGAKMYYAVPIEGTAWVVPPAPIMYLDPAGGGADEIGGGITTAVGPYIHLLSCFGLKGGLTDGNIANIAERIRKYGVHHVQVESNMGHGLFETLLQAALDKAGLGHVKVVGEYSTGQKERRIIDSMVSAMQRHKIVVHQDVFEDDKVCGAQHSIDKRSSYSFFQQMSSITTDRNSLPHDDRLEGAAGAIRHWKGCLAIDEEKASAMRSREDWLKFLNDPTGIGIPYKPRTNYGTKDRLNR